MNISLWHFKVWRMAKNCRLSGTFYKTKWCVFSKNAKVCSKILAFWRKCFTEPLACTSRAKKIQDKIGSDGKHIFFPFFYFEEFLANALSVSFNQRSFKLGKVVFLKVELQTFACSLSVVIKHYVNTAQCANFNVYFYFCSTFKNSQSHFRCF